MCCSVSVGEYDPPPKLRYKFVFSAIDDLLKRIILVAIHKVQMLLRFSPNERMILLLWHNASCYNLNKDGRTESTVKERERGGVEGRE